MAAPTTKPVFWVGSSRSDVRGFPRAVREQLGHALYLAQRGAKHADAKPLIGFGARVLEIVSDFDGNTFRAVYTVRFADTVYVLHAFQKKSRRGIATPRRELELVRQRLRAATTHHHHAIAGKDSP